MKKKTAAMLSAAAFAAGSALTLKLQQELKKDENKRVLYDKGNKTFYGALKGIASVLPEPPMVHLVDYVSENFYKGHDEFIDKPKKGAKWRLGFACDSIIPDDISTGEYYMGGYLSIPANRVEGVLDGLMFRCIAVDDGNGRGRGFRRYRFHRPQRRRYKGNEKTFRLRQRAQHHQHQHKREPLPFRH